MASLFDLLQSGQLPSDDASTPDAPSDAIAKLLAMLKPTPAGNNVPGIDVAPLSIAQPDPSPSMPSAAVPAPLANTPQAAASPNAPPPPVTTASTTPASPTPAAAPTMPMSLPTSGGDILRELGAFVGGLSGEGGIRSAMAQNQTDQQNNATLRALVAKGVKPDDAINMVQNPEILKTMLPTIFGTNPVEKASYGDTFYQRGPDGQMHNITAAGNGGTSNGLTVPGDNTLHGNDYVNSITDPNAKTLAAEAQSIVNGGETMPDAMSNRSPKALMLQQMVYQIDPTFTPAKAAQRKATLTELGKTEPNSVGGQINSGRAAVDHLANLADSAVNLNNSGGYFGTYRNEADTALSPSGGDRDSAVTGFTKNRQTFAGEGVKFITGGNGGEGDRQAAEANFGENMAPGALASALEASKQQMLEKFDSLQRSINSGLDGTGMAPQVLDDNAKAAIAKIDQRIAQLRSQQTGASSAPSPVRGAGPATPPAPITRTLNGVTYTKVNGQWMQ